MDSVHVGLGVDDWWRSQKAVVYAWNGPTRYAVVREAMGSARVVAPMRTAPLALACLAMLLLTAGGALGYRSCYLSGDLCADYDWNGGNAYADVQSPVAILGGGVYAGPAYRGYEAHVFAGDTYAYAYDGAWYGHEFTIVAVAVGGSEYVWYQQEGSRTSDDLGGYHCTNVWPIYSECGTGLLP